ncbi:MAG: DUF362 domain-containing protein [Acidobacteriia bacterium]|nr:DUF362 domain-containing protein [Terriglobia bacterium]
MRSASVLGGGLLTGAVGLSRPPALSAPATPVSVAKCKTYEARELTATLAKMFDQIGGLGRIVNGKTVAIKINMTGNSDYRVGRLSLAETHYTHPAVVGAAASLMAKAGARRIRVLECPWSTADPVEEVLLQAGLEPNDILRAAANVEFENTNGLGRGKKYSRFMIPTGGYVYPGFDLNHSYEECDVFVSIAKLKEHATAGYTGAMKNCFGMAPVTIYGDNAGLDEPAPTPRGGRTPFHSGRRQPSKSAPQEKDPASSRQEGYRVPRIVTDLVSARPIHLAIVEGIQTLTGGEGPWIRGFAPASPGLIIVGTNPVCTDAVSMATMNFDPMADRGTAPFETCDSTLKLAEDVGIGTRDLRRIEVVGTPIKDAMFDFAGLRAERRKQPPQGRRG